MTGVADIYSMETTAMRWDGQASGYTPRSPNVVYTFRSKSDAPCAVTR